MISLLAEPDVLRRLVRKMVGQRDVVLHLRPVNDGARPPESQDIVRILEHDLLDLSETQVFPVRGVEAGLAKIFIKLDRVAFGLAVGAAGGLMLSLATLFVLLGGGPLARPALGLLGQYFPGYEVTALGTVVGLAYGFVAGFASGWGFAFLRNVCLFLWITVLSRRASFHLLRRVLEFI
jgi:hypothetical protein